MVLILMALETYKIYLGFSSLMKNMDILKQSLMVENVLEILINRSRKRNRNIKKKAELLREYKMSRNILMKQYETARTQSKQTINPVRNIQFVYGFQANVEQTYFGQY